MPQGPETVAETLGHKRAVELGIRTGKIAEELKIGEHRDEHGPKSLVINWEDLRAAGISMSKTEFEKFLRDAGTPEEEVRAALSAKPQRIVGRSANSARKKPERTTPTTGATQPIPSVEAAEIPATPITPPKEHSRKRTATEDADGAEQRPAKKPRSRNGAKPKPAGVLATPPKSVSPGAACGASPSNPVVLADSDDEADTPPPPPQFAPPSPTISELEALLCEEE
ncbi:hypothetical protein ONZ43_g3674 [Nemania bipapillata]|uniref:Uncharacterized protein n=1 Tax=Nemania bipapillata TaxID=110536 RepID=A0ACC2IVX3_9PEZI|nr:hypothetical protein ONZ43_g3674 [Nemania bipapillata]